MKIYKLVIALGMIGGAFNSTFSAYGDNPPVNPYQPDRIRYGKLPVMNMPGEMNSMLTG